MNIEEAKLFYDMGRLDKAEIHCRKVLSGNPSNAPALHLLGCIAFKAGHIAPGTDLINRAIDLMPQNSSFLFDLGELLFRSENYSKAEKIFTKVIDLEPGNALAQLFKGNTIANCGRRSEAIECWFQYLSMQYRNSNKDEAAPSEENHPLNSSEMDCPIYEGSIHPYIICSTPRCGSTLLCDLLTQNGNLGVPHEYLNFSAHGVELVNRYGIDITDPNLSRAYLNTLKRVRTTPNGVFGLKAHYNQLSLLIDPPLLNEVFPQPKFAQIIRRNRIAQAISFSIAFQTQKWDSTKKKQNDPKYDAKLIDRFLSQILNQETEWSAFFQFNEIKPHIIHYEGLLEDGNLICKEFANFMEVETSFEFNIKASKFSRLRNHLNLEWENRYKSERSIFY